MAAPEYASGHDVRLSSRLKSAEYFYWTESGKPLWVLFNLDVVQQIEVEALSGFSALPRRGLEVFGARN